MYENRKVIVTLTTIPSRFKFVRDTLVSLIKQSIKPDEIVLSLPMESVREPCKGDPYKITDQILNEFKNHGVTIWRTKKDYGPATKLLGLLEREIPKNLSKEEESLIITVDDDKIYHKDSVKQLLEGWQRNQDCIVARKGVVMIQLKKTSKLYLSRKRTFDMLNRYHEIVLKGSDLTKDTEISILLGTGGVLYRASYFDDDIFDYKKKDKKFPSEKIFHTDDIYLSGYVSVKGIVKKAIYFAKNETINKIDNLKPNKSAVLDPDSRSRRINPLIDINSKIKNKKWAVDCLKYYEKYLIRK